MIFRDLASIHEGFIRSLEIKRKEEKRNIRSKKCGSGKIHFDFSSNWHSTNSSFWQFCRKFLTAWKVLPTWPLNRRVSRLFREHFRLCCVKWFWFHQAHFGLSSWDRPRQDFDIFSNSFPKDQYIQWLLFSLAIDV